MTADTGVDVVTGAFGYTGRHIARRLLEGGRQVRNLTGHPDRPDPFEGRVASVPFRFDDVEAMAAGLEGATTLYNTYWVRFAHGPVGFGQAVANSRTLFQAARRAGVARIVHVSITKPDASSRLPYFRGKALVEQALAQSGVPHRVVRPTVVFGPGDVLVNNIAWLLRRSPVFPVAGSGSYRIRPVHVDDVARLCVEAGVGRLEGIVEAVGPEVYRFVDLVRRVRDAVGSGARLVSVPPLALPVLAQLVGRVVGDVVLTREELDGLRAELVTTDGPATGEIRFGQWVDQHADELGRDYASELGRHFRPPAPPSPPVSSRA